MSNNEGVFTNTVTTAYDAEGRVVAQRGATYPVDYSYDEFGEKVSMTTYRTRGTGNGELGMGVQGDVTRWLRDEATGLVTNKVYADGKGPKYTYTPDGKLATRTWARGIVTTYSYDDNGSLTNTVYSDGTPTISLAYNRAGQQVRAEDAAGVTTFAYDEFGAPVNETVIGIAETNTIERFYDDFGRTVGYALNGIRQTIINDESDKGRMSRMGIKNLHSTTTNNISNSFKWNYLNGSDLKSSLIYPNGLTASWLYDANNQLLQVRNAAPTNILSQYDYVYDIAGRRIGVSKSGSAFAHNDSIDYDYNQKSELTNAVAAIDSDYRYAYDFDEIGNRETSFERGTNSIYCANNLNQYTAVDDFTPQFDDDGNQTLIKTATGIWSVTYNGENRPIFWAQGTNTIAMSYDRMGRRVTKNNQRFVYNGYLQIADSNGNAYIWDPTEPIATRPLVWQHGDSVLYYAHDGNKNVSEVVSDENEISAHYEYAPFGAVTLAMGEYTFSNPWRFSSEYADDSLVLVYYNYRHYEPMSGRWLSRDPIEENELTMNIYLFLGNTFGRYFDSLGQVPILPIFAAAIKSAVIEAVKEMGLNLLSSWLDARILEAKLVFDAALTSCGMSANVRVDSDGFHTVNLEGNRDLSYFSRSLRAALKEGATTLIMKFASGALKSAVKKHAREFITARPNSVYFEYYKKIETLIKKEGVYELTDEMAGVISEFAVTKIGDISSLINNLNITPSEDVSIKWEIEDECKICAVIKESFHVNMEIMGERQPELYIESTERKLKCFDYKELGGFGPAGREARRGCGICPCKEK